MNDDKKDQVYEKIKKSYLKIVIFWTLTSSRCNSIKTGHIQEISKVIGQMYFSQNRLQLDAKVQVYEKINISWPVYELFVYWHLNFHQYQQNEQSPLLNSLNTNTRPWYITFEILVLDYLLLSYYHLLLHIIFSIFDTNVIFTHQINVITQRLMSYLKKKTSDNKSVTAVSQFYIKFNW